MNVVEADALIAMTKYSRIVRIKCVNLCVDGFACSIIAVIFGNLSATSQSVILTG